MAENGTQPRYKETSYQLLRRELSAIIGRPAAEPGVSSRRVPPSRAGSRKINRARGRGPLWRKSRKKQSRCIDYRSAGEISAEVLPAPVGARVSMRIGAGRGNPSATSSAGRFGGWFGPGASSALRPVLGVLSVRCFPAIERRANARSGCIGAAGLYTQEFRLCYSFYYKASLVASDGSHSCRKWRFPAFFVIEKQRN